MRAGDIMTTPVVTAKPTMSVQEVASLLDENGVSAVPVVDDAGRPIGIVSEGDLLCRPELGERRAAPRRHSWWLSLFGSSGRSEELQDYIRSHGRTVADVMTQQVISVDENTPLSDVAALLETKQIKRVPVIRDGTLVGIVSRANLIRALATIRPPEIEGSFDDGEIRGQLLDELDRLDLVHIIHPSGIIVRNRIVYLWELDSLSSLEERHALRVAAENIPGVLDVKEYLVPASIVPGWYTGR